MISGQIIKELESVGSVFLSGALITLVYDCLRIFRRVMVHGNFWIGIEDFVFWIWTTFWMFSVLYRENDGSLRMYTILLMVAGMLVYHYVISEFFVKVMAGILNGFLRILFLPLKKFWKSIIMKNSQNR